MSEKVLVTGASGFIASHTIIDLLNAGYTVRGTVRDLARVEKLKTMFAQHTDKTDQLEFVAATLTDSACWETAMSGCSGVFHIASPVPVAQPDNPDDLIIPAREGTLNVLRAARAANIKRVVLTSSVAAITGNSQPAGHLNSASDWTDPGLPGLTPYVLSKTAAERAAWDFVADGGPELVTVNPALVLGPALEADYGSSLEVLALMMRGKYPLVPKIGFGIVDVRDVASLHRIAFEHPDAVGQRLIASNGFMWMLEVADVLRKTFPDYQGKLPKRHLPNLIVRLLSRFDKVLATIVKDVGKVKDFDNQPALDLGWQPRGPVDAINAGGKSLIETGVV